MATESRQRDGEWGKEGNSHLKPLKPFSGPDRRGCSGSNAVAAIKFGTLDFHRGAEVGVIPATVRLQPPVHRGWETREREGRGYG